MPITKTGRILLLDGPMANTYVESRIFVEGFAKLRLVKMPAPPELNTLTKSAVIAAEIEEVWYRLSSDENQTALYSPTPPPIYEQLKEALQVASDDDKIGLLEQVRGLLHRL